MAVNATPGAAASPAAASGDPGQTGANAQGTSPEPTPSSSPSQSGQESRGPDYFREAFNRVRGYRQTVDQAARNREVPAPQAPPAQTAKRPETERNGAAARSVTAPGSERPAQRQAPRQAPQPNTVEPDQPNQRITLTPEQFARSVQSEVDRVLTKREQDDRARRAKEEELALREDDPFEYVKRLKEQEAQAATVQERTKETIGYLEQQLHHYDRGVLDEVMRAVPEKARATILKSVKADGIPGRAELVKHGLKALQQYWQYQGREGARTDLMKDEKFIKEVLARYGGSPGEVEPTPSLPPSAAASRLTSNDSVNNWMRTSSAVVRQNSGRR